MLPDDCLPRFDIAAQSLRSAVPPVDSGGGSGVLKAGRWDWVSPLEHDALLAALGIWRRDN